MLKWFLRVKKPVAQLKQLILHNMSKIVNRRINVGPGPEGIVREVRQALRRTLQSHPTVVALKEKRSLIGELGLTNMAGQQGSDPSDRINNIIDFIVDSVIVKYDKPSVKGNKVQGKVIIQGIPYDDILNLKEAYQETEPFRNEGPDELHWLKWILEMGGQIIVSTHHYEMVPEHISVKHSRTEMGVMKKKLVWSVPDEYQGTRKDNFITQSIAQVLKYDVPKILNKLLR